MTAILPGQGIGPRMCRIVCRSCLSLLGCEVEVYTIAILVPRRCDVCGEWGEKQGRDFDAVSRAVAEEAHRKLCEKREGACANQ